MIDKSKEYIGNCNIKVVPMKTKDSYDTRFCIIDKDTGEVIDDAQGYGYKTKQKAYAAWTYKTRKISSEEVRLKEEKTKKIKQWIKEHKSFMNLLEGYELEIAKGSGDPNDTINTEFIKNLLIDCNIEIDFKVAELRKVIYKGKL